MFQNNSVMYLDGLFPAWGVEVVGSIAAFLCRLRGVLYIKAVLTSRCLPISFTIAENPGRAAGVLQQRNIIILKDACSIYYYFLKLHCSTVVSTIREHVFYIK